MKTNNYNIRTISTIVHWQYSSLERQHPSTNNCSSTSSYRFQWLNQSNLLFFMSFRYDRCYVNSLYVLLCTSSKWLRLATNIDVTRWFQWWSIRSIIDSHSIQSLVYLSYLYQHEIIGLFLDDHCWTNSFSTENLSNFSFRSYHTID
jgi:hypothetical protein